MPDLSKYRKLVTAIIGGVLAIAAAFAPGKYDTALQALVLIATAIGVYGVTNEPA